MQNNIYLTYSEQLRANYGEKVYKLPINLPILCPNRLNSSGCTFCAEVGTGFESLSNSLSVKEQLEQNMAYIQKKYKAKKFIAYFQNYTNTYMPLEVFKQYIREAAMVDNIVEIAISTRPDCIQKKYLDFLQEIAKEYQLNIHFELGLQTVNYHSLDKINRGHSLAEFLEAAILIGSYGFELCVHLILNLPWDNERDSIEAAKILSVLPTTSIKLHSLYIAKNTPMALAYLNKEIDICSMDDYVNRVIDFLCYLRPDISIQRLVGRAPEEETIFCNWETSWWKIRDNIEEKMRESGKYQGISYNYTNGSALRMRCW